MDQPNEILNRNPATVGRWVLIALLVPYILWLILAYRYHFLDGVNLLLHEAGHVVFLVFGQTAHFLGGTLGQLLFPALFAAYFLKRNQRFEACIVGIWFAESLMYTAAYISDARALALPLVGGHIHDWNWLLARWGVLRHAESIGSLVHVSASITAIVLLYLAAVELTPPRRAGTQVVNTPPSMRSRRTANSHSVTRSQMSNRLDPWDPACSAEEISSEELPVVSPQGGRQR